MLKYEDNLWGKTEQLHNLYKSNYLYYKEFIEFIDKIRKAYLSFSESLNGLFSKKINFFEEKPNILFSLLSDFKDHIKFQSQEYKELSNNIGKEIIDIFKNSKHNNDKDEENLYKEFNELTKKLKKSKQILETNKSIYNNSMKETEKLTFEAYSTKENPLTSNQEIKTKKEIAYSSICDSLKNEDNYTNSLDETNKLINELNLKEKELLNFYQSVDEKRLNNIKNNISLLLIFIKTNSFKINYEIDIITKKINELKIENDINDFITQNKSSLSPEKNIKFKPYAPFTSLDNSIKSSSENEEMNIKYEVITYLKKFFDKLCPNIDMEEEKKRLKLRVLCLNIFDENDQKFVEEDKNELIKFMENAEYRNYFLSSLTHQRLNGKFKREEKLFNELKEILNVIVQYAEKEKNYENVRNCIILSQTFYKEKIDDEGNIEKEYLMEHIKKNKWLSTPLFWKEFIEDEIIKDKLKFEEESKSKDGSIIGDVRKIYFSKLITYSHNMNMFELSKKETTDIIDYFMKKYEISDDMKVIVINNIEAAYSEKKVTPKPKIEKKQNLQNNEIINSEIKMK